MKRNRDPIPLTWTVTRLDRSTGRKVGDPIPAQVPGDVFTDLMRAKIIPDPYIGLDSEKVQWVNECDWLYRGEAGEIPSGGRAWLEFMGLDYRYAVSWNGREMLRQEGMFSRVLLEVAPADEKPDAVEVRFKGFPDRFYETMFPPVIVNTEPIRRRVTKTSMSFGWDFAPRLKGCGVWDDASLFRTGPVLIHDLLVRAGNDGSVFVEAALDSSCDCRAALEFTLRGESFSGDEVKGSIPVDLRPGMNRASHSLRIDSPRPWMPWDQGEPNLYRLDVRVTVEGGESDSAFEVFGFRDIEWARNPGSPRRALDWTLVVNGRREFLRGANVIPPDSMAGRRTDERCARLLELARDANLNCIRLWGGGNRERSVIYDACDRLGIMVWQEFPIGCINFGTPRSARYMKLLERECSEMVRQLRNRPSIIMWCGGNEFNTRLSKPAIRLMELTCKELDPTRRFVPASPYRGDAHNWLVWHIKGNLKDYENDQSQLVSEFGLQAAPAAGSLEKFLPGDLLWPPGKGWVHHHQSRAKMEKYVRHFGGPGGSLPEFVAASQKAQAYYLHRGIETWRRKKYEKSGAMFWQWNDPWPCISWSVVDYFLEPKLGYEAVKTAFQPLLVCAEFEQKKNTPGDSVAMDIVAVNDLHREFKDLKVDIIVSGRVVETLRADVGPDSVARLGSVTISLPSDAPPVIELSATCAGAEVSRNRYHLDHYDPQRASLLGRRLFRRWWQFLTD